MEHYQNSMAHDKPPYIPAYFWEFKNSVKENHGTIILMGDNFTSLIGEACIRCGFTLYNNLLPYRQTLASKIENDVVRASESVSILF